MRIMRRSSLPVKFALELFAGSGNLSAEWRKIVQVPIVEFDIRWGDRYDLVQKKQQQLIRGWLTAGWVIAVWMGPPSSSFSRARDRPGGPVPLRSDAKPLGLEEMDSKDAEKVRMGNELMKFVVGVLSLCRRWQVPAAVENPAGSRIWLCPAMLEVLRWEQVRVVHTDFCQFGSLHRKKTRIMSIFVDLESTSRTCTGQKLCTATGRRHLDLKGTCGNISRTTLADAYPEAWCRRVCFAFRDALTAAYAETLSRSWI